MAKKTGGRTGLIMFAVFGAIVAVALTVWILGDLDRAKQEDAAAAAIVPTLPAGRLQVIRPTSTGTEYLALDELTRAGQTADVAVVTVARTLESLEGGGAIVVRRARIDCAAQRVFEGLVGTFDTDGKLVGRSMGFAGKRGRPVEPGDAEVPVVCQAKTARTVADWRTAQRETQVPPEGLANAAPSDGHAWAWLCASAARGHWRPQAFDDCGRALKLRPDDAGTLTDQGYLSLKTGRWSVADASFSRVLAADPKNAGALYGKSLLKVLTRDEAGGRVWRGKALDVDETIPAWAATTYQMPISQEYRVR